jgi:general secretion pathway protein G
MKGCSRAQSILVIALTISAIAVIVGIRLLPFIFERSRISSAYRDLYYLPRFFEKHRSVTGRLPTNEEGFKALIQRPEATSGRWLKTMDVVPIDPWGNRYHYRRSVRKGIEVPEILSAGTDGQFGTEDDLSSLKP